MCSACDSEGESRFEPRLNGQPSGQPSGQSAPNSLAPRRRKIWEVQGTWGCSIVGTCVSLAELRALARKLGLKTNPDFPMDYQLHGHFASEVALPGRTAKLLNKLLDKKHAGTIRRLSKVRCAKELERTWTEALASGEIPGPYWAILTHPHTPPALAERAFADVHMLSHMVGASNRADIRVLCQLQEENAHLGETLRKEKERAQRNGEKKQQIIDDLRDDAAGHNLARLKAEVEVERLRRRGGQARPVADAEKHRQDAARYRRQYDALADELRAEQQRAEQLDASLAAMHGELAALEAAMPAELYGDMARQDDGKCAFDLNGRCILYVGGRSSYVCRLRSLVEQWNGELLHHDGGLEKSIDELAGAVVRSDAVVFPTDCVSHSAANKVKRLCRQTMKPFVPLRSSGVGSFVAGLQLALDQSSA